MSRFRIKKPPHGRVFAAAAEVGGVISNAETAERKALAAYGRNLGIAFQLIDDALDYGSVNRVLGKNIGEDFAEGKVTLPVILAYHRGDKTARAFWEEAVSTPNDDPTRLDQALELIAQTDALTDTIERDAAFLAFPRREEPYIIAQGTS